VADRVDDRLFRDGPCNAYRCRSRAASEECGGTGDDPLGDRESPLVIGDPLEPEPRVIASHHPRSVPGYRTTPRSARIIRNWHCEYHFAGA
jgi:hypothetical protein